MRSTLRLPRSSNRKPETASAVTPETVPPPQRTAPARWGRVKADAFVFGLPDFFGGNAHMTHVFKEDEMGFSGSQPLDREGAVKGHAAPAEDGDAFAVEPGAVEVRFPQEPDGRERVFDAGDVQTALLSVARRD